MDRVYAKIGALVGCFIIPFVCTLLPLKVYTYFVRKGAVGEKILSCLMCFGGGVFFATYILHMAPESRAIVEYSLAEPNNITYPIADLIMAAGFFLVLFCEQFVMLANKRKTSRSSSCVQFKSGSETSSSAGSAAEKCRQDINNKTRSKLADVEDLGNTDCALYGSGSCCKDSDEVVVQINATEVTEFFTSSKAVTRTCNKITLMIRY